ncbi:MAG: hypothetical protein WC998_08000 [Candidatus Paceibacterota bacterium]|jgi:hypothetical protein
MKLITDDTNSWGTSLSDFSPEYQNIKCWNVLQFFTLNGRKSVIKKDNIIPIPFLRLALYSPQEKRYYYKEYQKYNIESMYLRRLESNEDMDKLRRYISDGNLYLLLSDDQVKDTTAMLERLYKSHYIGVGKVPYKIWLRLLAAYLDYEDYKDYGVNLVGFRTVCKTFEDSIRTLWEQCYKN